MLSAYAEHLTPDAALARAFDNGTAMPARVRAEVSSMGLDRTFYSAEGTPVVYLMRNTVTALLLPADDVAEPVLGYFDNVAEGALPPQLEWWISEYAREIQFAVDNPSLYSGSLKIRANATDTKAPISPMCSTVWNQSTPFNNLCPMVNGERAVTGCVATAMAQVMKYHNYPESGTGIVSYTDDYSGTSVTRTLSFNNKPFDWANMLDSYNGTYSATQAKAVAWLMQACGYAAHMGYTASASGAQTGEMLNGVKQYFKYNEKGAALNRGVFSKTDWDNIVYNNLSTVGPVFYAGSNSANEGHAFVCDGYSGDGFYHFNWGWGGAYDGYFKLNALAPEGQGIGGNSGGGFNYNQQILINVTPPGHPTIEIPESCPIMLLGDLTGENSGNVIYFSSTMAESTNVAFYNSGESTINVKFGYEAYNTATGTSSFTAANSQSHSLPTGAGFTEYPMSVNLSKGTYNIYVAARIDGGAWQRISHSIGNTDYLVVTVGNSGSITSVTQPQAPQLDVTDLVAESSIYWGKPIRLSFKLANSADEEIVQSLIPVLFRLSGSSVTLLARGTDYQADLMPGESESVTWPTNMTTSTSGNVSGSAYLGLADSSTGAIVIYIPVTIKAVPSGDLSMTATSFTMEGDRNSADAANLKFNFSVRCNSSVFASPIYVFIADKNNNIITSFISSESYILGPSDNATGTVSGAVQDEAPGTTLYAHLGYVNENMAISLKTLSFTLSNSSGISATDAVKEFSAMVDRDTEILSVTAPAAITSVELYSLDGRRFTTAVSADGDKAVADLSPLPAGVLLVKVALADGSYRTAKVVR